MTIDDFQEKVKISKHTTAIDDQIFEMMELFTDLANLPYISYYQYNYEYNDFIYNFTIDKNGQNVDFPTSERKTYKILLKKNRIVYGYILLNEKLTGNLILKKLLSKIRKYLEIQKELEKKLLGSDVSFKIFLFYDKEVEFFAKNLQDGLRALFNVDILLDTSISNHLNEIKVKDTRNVIIYLVDNEINIRKNEDTIKYLNELIIVIGPNDHHLSMYCGKLGIQNYIPITEFRAEDVKSIILNTRNELMNKNKNGNKIIALTGISGGIGTTTIAMNMADLLARNLPSKNILYIDLASTKAISNLFLEKNPLPSKTIIDLMNSSEFNIESNLKNGLIKKNENFYCITGIQRHIDKEYLEQDIFIEKLLEYISFSSDYFDFIIIDVGISDASNLKSTIYDIVNELWMVSEMTLPHISKIKTFYSLMKRAGLKDKISFIVNRYDSQNAISVNDVTSILNMASGEKIKFDEFQIPNDYQSLGKCWNYCELASEKAKDSKFIEKLELILEKKDFYKKDEHNQSRNNWFSSLFKKNKL